MTKKETEDDKEDEDDGRPGGRDFSETSLTAGEQNEIYINIYIYIYLYIYIYIKYM